MDTQPPSAPAPARWTSRELRALAAVATVLRRRAMGLPEGSSLRAELLEAAEYYRLGADEGYGAPEPGLESRAS